MMILNQDGNFSEYGEDSIELINAVSKMPSTMRIITGIRMNDYYALSPNNTTLIALTQEARKVLDGETGTVAKLRTVQKKDWEDYKNNPPAPDAIWDENGWLSPNGELYITGEPPADLGAAAETADLSNGHASIGINLPTWVIAVISISALTLIIGIVAFGKLKTSIIRNE
ncbi:MAG: hypothetical protein SPG61_03515 [Arcanobacterium sp.]|nr:hypothetical protein [Arcanobacterium sp.]